MSRLPVIPRAVARRDVDDATMTYVEDGFPDIGLDFIDSVEEALATLAEHPHIGSPRWGEELAIPGMRSWPVRNHPYLVFYLPHTDHIDIWRVLHVRRDLPAVFDE